MEFIAKTFDELNTSELYELLRARFEIFVTEQKIMYQDMDGIDREALHCFLWDKDTVLACLRACREDEDTVKIGRVLSIRHGEGLGQRLMEQSLPAIVKRFPCKKLRISSQKHAVGFYELFGFRCVSDEFLEADIPHIYMELDTDNILR